MTSYPLPENLRHQAIDSPEFICIPDLPVTTELPEEMIDYARVQQIRNEMIADAFNGFLRVFGSRVDKVNERLARKEERRRRRIKSYIDHYGEFNSVPEIQLAVTVPAPETRKVTPIVVFGSRINYGRTAYMERLIAEKQREGKRVLIFDVLR